MADSSWPYLSRRDLLALSSATIASVSGCISLPNSEQRSKTSSNNEEDRGDGSTAEQNTSTATDELSTPIVLSANNKSEKRVTEIVTITTRDGETVYSSEITLKPEDERQIYETQKVGFYYVYFGDPSEDNRYIWTVCSNYSDAELVIPTEGSKEEVTVRQMHSDPSTQSSPGTSC